MQLPAVLAALAVTFSAAPTPQLTPQQRAALERLKAQCPQTTSHLAEQGGLYRGERLAPRKLTELPPATTYMAVFRHIGSCEAPLTMIEYRNPKRR